MWLTLIFAETIAAQSGIGYMAMQAREFMQTDVIVLSILLYALLGKGADTPGQGSRAVAARVASCLPGAALTPMSPASLSSTQGAAHAARRQKVVRSKDDS